MSTWEEFASTVLKTPDASAKLGANALEEVRSGSAIMVPKLVWLAQKIVQSPIASDIPNSRFYLNWKQYTGTRSEFCPSRRTN